VILERIAASGFRAFAERVEFTPDARFTVIAAPNGTGKSTLIDAIYFGLLERHSVTGMSAEQRFKSIGRDLTPVIEIDFAVDDARYRLRKTFLSGTKSASLQRLESGRYVGIKDGSAADDFVRDLFFADPPGRGALDPNRNLGFAHVLLSPGRASFVSLPDGAGNEIRAMLGGAALSVTVGERSVQERVTAEYLKYFTEEGAHTSRAGSVNIPALVLRVAQARAAEVEARKACLSLERLAVAYADSAADAERMEALRSGLRADIDATKSSVKIFNELQASAERAARAEVEARLPYESCADRVSELAVLRTEHAALMRDRASCSSELEKQSNVLAQLSEQFRAARQAVEDTAAAVTEIQGRAAAVTAARSYVDSAQTVSRLAALIASYDAAQQKIADLSNARSAVVAPSRSELEALRNATAEADALQATIAASALTLEIDADSNLIVDVVAGEGTGPRELRSGSSTTFLAADAAVIIDVPGLGRIRARATDGAAKARKKLQPLVAQRDAARARYGTASIAELAIRLEGAEQIERSLAQTQTERDALLDERPITAVRQSLAEAIARVGAIDNEYPAWRSAPPNAAALRDRFDRDLQAATDAFKIAQIDMQTLETPMARLELEVNARRTHDAGLAIKLDANAARQAVLAQDGLDDVARTERTRELALKWHAARAAQADAAERLAAYSDDPRNVLVGLERAERESGTAYEHALAAARACRTQLDTQTNLGSYAQLAAAEERLAQCESDLAAAQRQAAAVAALFKAFERIRAEHVAAVVEPVTIASTRYLTRIAGLHMGNIAIGDGLAPHGLIDAASRLRLAIDGTLSTGEKEQIYLATRLALAEIIAKQRGRQLFVVDDAMTATDPNRLRRFIAILEELSRDRLQVVVTTADRSRYLGVNGAKHVDLARVLLAASAA
jgi:hypothetical protein